jgi:hypothetical protein
MEKEKDLSVPGGLKKVQDEIDRVEKEMKEEEAADE